MARTWVASDDLVDGTLPPVCARTGVPTEHRVSMPFAAAPAWAQALLRAGVPVVLLSPVSTDRVEGLVPLRRAEEKRLLRLLAVRNTAIAAAAVALALWAALDLLLLGVLALLAAVVVVVWTAVGVRTSVAGQLDGTGDWVELDGVHPRFVRQADARYAEDEGQEVSR